MAGRKSGYYEYDPSKPAAIAFAIIFLITALGHTFQLFKKRTWYFIPFLIGGFFETIGYIGRYVSANQNPNYTLGPYIIQVLLILLAPALFAASIYMVLGRLILLTDGQANAPIRANWLTKIFVLGDVISFLAQCGGGGILAGAQNAAPADAKKKINLGQNVITVGLGIQVLFFGLFIVVTTIFHLRMKKRPTARSLSLTVSWESGLYALYGASALILIRSIFRIAEYMMGQDGVLLQHEFYSYIFDAGLMFLAMVLFNFKHPSAVLGSSSTLKGRDIEGVHMREESYIELRQEGSAKLNGQSPQQWDPTATQQSQQYNRPSQPQSGRA